MEATGQQLVEPVLARLRQGAPSERIICSDASFAGSNAGESSRAMICAGTTMMWVTFSAAMVAIIAAASNCGCRM